MTVAGGPGKRHGRWLLFGVLDFAGFARGFLGSASDLFWSQVADDTNKHWSSLFLFSMYHVQVIAQNRSLNKLFHVILQRLAAHD